MPHTPRATPRATPVARAPKSSVAPHEQASASPALEAPIVIVAPEGDRELRQGSLSVGRLFAADIWLDDPLVSRVHARISVADDGTVRVEDLKSTNGVFLNGVRIPKGTSALSDGDRLLIGTTELSVFSAKPRERPTERPRHRAPPSSPPSVPSLPFSDLPRRSESLPVTARAEGIELVGKVAMRHAANGDLEEAVRVLSNHLNKLLLSTTGGLVLSEQQLDRATEYGLELYRWTDNSAWIDYVIDLHFSMQALPSERVLGLLERLLGDHDVKFDRLLLVYLVEKLERRKTALNSLERARLTRLDRIARFL